MDYYVEDIVRTLSKVKNNPYGIKDTPHSFERAQKRNVDLNLVNSSICNSSLVGIVKSFNENSIFELLYEHDKKEDLSIIIILNEEEIDIITIIKKNYQQEETL